MRIVNIELNCWTYIEVKDVGMIRVFITLDAGEYVLYFDAPKAISIRREDYIAGIE